ncbi:MAG: hypothetical protein B6D61_05095 [Bacteroidetes bacterium 4484_249]|nr:MAG: hypothetical protein B6D61_05095 [Bacteroidetes bacterium 4484_249]
MKTKVIILTIFVIMSIGLQSQNSFEFILQDTLSSKCFSTFIDDQNYFVSLGSTGNPDIYEYDGMILKFKTPEDVSINIFEKPDTILFLRFGFLMTNGNYFVTGTIDDNSDVDLKNLYIMELSPELEIINEKIYGIPDIYNKLYLYNLYVDSDSNIVINGKVEDPPPGNINDLYVAKLNLQGELLDTLINTQFNADFFSELLGKPDNSGYYLIGGFGFARLIELDNSLNILSYQPLDPNNSYNGAIGARWLPDGNIIIGSLANQDVPNAFYDLRVRVTGEDLEPIRDTVIFDDGFNWLPAINGLDYTDVNNIWVVTYPQLGKSTSDWEYGRIYIFDQYLNVKGAKYFGGTLSLYLYSIKALDDGGCIITGIAADEQNKGYTDVYIKKVMPEDILTNAEETPEQNDIDVLVYPVPFGNELNIETYRRGLNISLHSMEGHCIISQSPLNIPNTQINTSNLEKGFYNYSIYDNGKIIQSGKIIKQ